MEKRQARLAAGADDRVIAALSGPGDRREVVSTQTAYRDLPFAAGALVVGLQGRFQEAETIAKGDLSPSEAAANVAYLRQMLAQQSDWKKGKRGSPLVPTTGS